MVPKKRTVRSVSTEEGVIHSDHKGGNAGIASTFRINRRGKVYPTPSYVQAATNSLIEHKLQEIQTSMDKAQAGELAAIWDGFV